MRKKSTAGVLGRSVFCRLRIKWRCAIIISFLSIPSLYSTSSNILCAFRASRNRPRVRYIVGHISFICIRARWMKIIFFRFFAQRVIVRAVSSVAILVLCRVYANACDSACNRFVGRYAITRGLSSREHGTQFNIFYRAPGSRVYIHAYLRMFLRCSSTCVFAGRDSSYGRAV